jgi:hypothetical protein
MLLEVLEMVCQLPQLHEMDNNPITANASCAVAAHTRIAVDGAPFTVHNQARLAIPPSRHAMSSFGRCEAEAAGTRSA